MPDTNIKCSHVLKIQEFSYTPASRTRFMNQATNYIIYYLKILCYLLKIYCNGMKFCTHYSFERMTNYV